MRNTTVLATRKDFNPFTLALKVRCEAEGEVLVRMRNGDYCKVVYRPANPEDYTGEAFHKTDHSSYWDPNGEYSTMLPIAPSSTRHAMARRNHGASRRAP